MRIPPEPQSGYSIAAKVAEIIHYLRGERLVSVIGGRLQESPNGKTLIINAPKTTKAGGPSSIKLMWKVAKVGSTDAEPPLPIFSVRGGIAVIQGTRVVVAGVAELEATAEGGLICLKVVRDSSSREYDGDYPPEIVWQDTQPTSQDYEEFTVLAEYSESTGVVQCRNDEICSFEGMFFENGEFKLLPIQANSRNSYNLPA